MRVVIAIDAFKGSLSSLEAGRAASRGVHRVAPDAEVQVFPVADGGEGTVEALTAARGGRAHPVRVHDTVGVRREVSLTITEDATALVESARVVGLGDIAHVDDSLVSRGSSTGVGELIAHATHLGAARVLVALGGTACTDGGTGLLLALGARLWDAQGTPILAEPGTNPLLRGPVRVELPAQDVRIEALTDVSSPLLGETGAARLFGPQKGANAAHVEILETHMSTWARALAEATGADVAAVAGSGAAGGIGAALVALGAEVVPGFGRIAAETGLADAMEGADLVLTGEGRIDAQTALGKTPVGVARLARARGARAVVALAGSIEIDDVDAFDAVVPIHSRPRMLAEAMDEQLTRAELARTAAQIVRLLAVGR